MKQLRCALYPRVSTEEQFVHGLSLDAQKKDLIDYANRMGYVIVGIYPDEGISARKPVSKRPAMLRLLEDVKQDKIDIVIVTKLDRWFRNIKEYQITEDILRSHGCYWKTIFEDYDTSTANGQMIVNIMLAVAQNECDRTSERIKTVFRHKILNGQHVTGAAPYGYELKDKKLQKNPVTEHVVNDIFQYYFSCFSKRKTTFYILDKYKDFDMCPTKYQINRILSSETYAGIYNDISNYYPSYITEDQHHAICQNSDSKSYPRTMEPYIFSGLIKCPVCGSTLSGTTKKHTCNDGTVTCYKRYKCAKKFDKHVSSGPCITERVIEEYMLANLCPELDNVIFMLSQKAVSTYSPNDCDKIKDEMNRLNILFQKGRITDVYYDEQYEILEKKLGSLSEPIEPVIKKFENMKSEFSGDWKQLYSCLDPELKNAFWKRIIREIKIDKDTHKICGFSFL